MIRKFFRKPGSIGHSPGTLISIKREAPRPLVLSLFEYGPDRPASQRLIRELGDCLPFDPDVPVSWLNIDGSHQVDFLKEIGNSLAIHPLALEDILDTSQRPKIEDYEKYLFIELNQLLWDQELSQIQSEQVSLVLGEKYLISFQEHEQDVFDPVRKRIQEGKGRLTRYGADYLAYALIDAVVDHYFVVLEHIGEQIEILEEQLITNPTPDTLQSIHELKRELIFMRKSIWPLREVIGTLERGENSLFQESILIFLRDVYEHTIQIIDTVETFREMVSGMLDIYLSSISNRMNEVMKVLTIIATIFIPLSFFTGLYGMNFVYMPELQWRWGYFALLAFLGLVLIGMLIYFKRKRWI